MILLPRFCQASCASSEQPQEGIAFADYPEGMTRWLCSTCLVLALQIASMAPIKRCWFVRVQVPIPARIGRGGEPL